MQLNLGQPAREPPAPPPEPPAPPANPKKVALQLTVYLGGGLVLAALITSLVLWLSADMRDTTHRFLDHARKGREDEAYAMLTSSMQARVPRSAFASYVDRNAPGLRASGGEWINGFSGELTRTCMEVWLDGGHGTVYVILDKENGVWRVDDVTSVEIDLCSSE